MKIGHEAISNIPGVSSVHQASPAEPLLKVQNQSAAPNNPGPTPLDQQAVLDHAIGSAPDPSDGADALRNAIDSLQDMSDLDSLRLQQYMDNKSKFEETLSNIEKKQDDTASQILKNLKG
jgi:hypothetical protein